MCLIIFAIDSHPDYPLIVAANRDEFYARETLPMHRWDDPEGLLAGKDMTAGGTWLGVSEEHGIAMLTNYRDPSNIDPNAPSRGALVSDYFKEKVRASDYLTGVSDKGAQYNGFNLICGGGNGYYYYGNYGNGVQALPGGIHGLSNALINDPWPKVVKGKEMLAGLIKSDTLNPGALLDMMFDADVADDIMLPDTGVGRDMERLLSPMFIKSPEYGSRSTTAVMVSVTGEVTVVERSYDHRNGGHDEREFTLQW